MSAVKSFLTIKKKSQHVMTVKKSRFIGKCFYVETQQECLDYHKRVQEEFPDATHHCWAYNLGLNCSVQKFSDDGEPGGTAGLPILKVIQHKGLKNTMVIITRYYGGIKLGAGGLVRAYSGSCSETLKLAGRVVKELSCSGTVILDYQYSPAVDYFLRNNDYIIKNIEYTDKVQIDLVSRTSWKDFTSRIMEICNGDVIVSEAVMVWACWD